MAERPSPPRIPPPHAFGPLTVIANNPERTCIAESSPDECQGLACPTVIANDPNAVCRAECAPLPAAFGYRPAYELTDGSLERAGRLSGVAALAGMVP